MADVLADVLLGFAVATDDMDEDPRRGPCEAGRMESLVLLLGFVEPPDCAAPGTELGAWLVGEVCWVLCCGGSFRVTAQTTRECIEKTGVGAKSIHVAAKATKEKKSDFFRRK